MDFVARTGFGHIHIFPFSARAGTKAARLPNQLDGATKKARSREMHALAAELKRRELMGHIGARAEVLWEQQVNNVAGQWIGYTPHYHKILSANPEIRASNISEVGIDALSEDGAALVSHADPVGIAIADIGRYAG
jgi:threonylcarbamoyladenosine tRNA methylthiotransferase MtaB